MALDHTIRGFYVTPAEPYYLDNPGQRPEVFAGYNDIASVLTPFVGIEPDWFSNEPITARTYNWYWAVDETDPGSLFYSTTVRSSEPPINPSNGYLWAELTATNIHGVSSLWTTPREQFFNIPL